MQLRYWGLILLLGLGWGSSFFFNEILLRELGPLTVALGRVGTGALGCWIWLLARRAPMRIPAGSLGVLTLFAAIQYAIPLTVFPVTQQYITSSAAGIVNATTPVMAVAVSHFWPGGERATWMKSIGVGLGLAGIVVLVSPAFRGQGASDPWALLATMIAPFCYGIALNLMRRFDGMNRTLLTAWSLLIGTAMLAPVALGLEGMPHIERAETWAALFVIGFVLTAGAFILLFWLIPIVGGTTASTITFLTPVSAVLLGVLILAEPIGPAQIAGMAVIFSGLIFIDGRLPRRFLKPQPDG
ncbi:putative DMT superfamily transporter inner membrane protein [Pseudoruegeria aquimaris]|uniref:Putative DMT superfamily transporter inner membrane protein n=1 Tax=Pseudoruegeria aquimaris TaxID=393663 RepID=A0A1Y5S1S6_9RHOB|nr:DMT family transporter [Pseudoruegeria aquimaris]SLN29295.1 putative DMT superfamily transporter inner membrane protein [Pseudoruegeria aquimaris]